MGNIGEFVREVVAAPLQDTPAIPDVVPAQTDPVEPSPATPPATVPVEEPVSA